MKSLGGHNFAYTRSVETALAERGLDVTVFAHKGLAPDLATTYGYRPVFSLGTYDLPPGNGPWRDLFYLYHQSAIYADDLARALRESGGDFDLVLCHTVSDFELIGWSRFLARRKLPGHLAVIERLTPQFHSANRLKLLAHPYWRMKPHYLNSLRRRMRGRFTLFTDSDVLSDDYRRIYRHGVVTLPIPIDVSDGGDWPEPGGPLPVAERYGLDGSLLSMGYLGDARGHKGFHLLPQAVRAVLAEPGLRVRFVIQCTGNDYDRFETDSVAELRRLAQEHNSRLTLIPERLSERDYSDLLRSLDVVLIPYTDRNFTEGTSNIFAEALALSKPVVVSSGTWMAAELRKSGGGLECERGSADDLAAKCMAVAREYDSFAARAREFAPKWREFHNPRTLVETVLGECRIEVAAERGQEARDQ
jgi:glycosyltransferase involved in cell wall biosynthesis